MMYQQPSCSFCLKLILTSLHYLRLVSSISSSFEDLFPFSFIQTLVHHLFCLLYLSTYLYHCPISPIEKTSPSALSSHFLTLYCLYLSFALKWYSVVVFIFSPLIGSSNNWNLTSISTTIQITNGSHQLALHWLITMATSQLLLVLFLLLLETNCYAGFLDTKLSLFTFSPLEISFLSLSWDALL